MTISDSGKIYVINDEILKDIFGSHKNNNERCLGWTYFKVKLLNDFYSTGIQNIYTVVEDMIKIKNLDENIKNGDFQAVNEIRDIFKNNKENKNSRNIYSFATKFCHFSNPDMRYMIIIRFPPAEEIIYDNNQIRWYIPQGTLKDLINFSAEELSALETAKELFENK